MATLLELHTIEQNSKLAYDAAEAAQITQARELRQRLRVAACKYARTVLSDASSLPSTDPDRTAALELIAWAKQAVQAPDGVTDTIMRLALAGASGNTTTQILGLSDTVLENSIAPLVPLLAKGMQLVR